VNVLGDEQAVVFGCRCFRGGSFVRGYSERLPALWALCAKSSAHRINRDTLPTLVAVERNVRARRRFGHRGSSSTVRTMHSDLARRVLVNSEAVAATVATEADVHMGLLSSEASYRRARAVGKAVESATVAFIRPAGVPMIPLPCTLTLPKMALATRIR
jgi:hypothetical protein